MGGKTPASEYESHHTLGSIDISFYRDDFSRIGLHPEVKASEIPDDIEDRCLILVDDVLQTGRTIRAALNEIFSWEDLPPCNSRFWLSEAGVSYQFSQMSLVRNLISTHLSISNYQDLTHWNFPSVRDIHESTQQRVAT